MTTMIDMAGPWQAVALDPMGYTLDPHDEDDDMSECDQIAVVRRTAAPVTTGGDCPKMPTEFRYDDVLYRLDDLQDEPDRVPTLLAQAVATAEALNRAYPVATA